MPTASNTAYADGIKKITASSFNFHVESTHPSSEFPRNYQQRNKREKCKKKKKEEEETRRRKFFFNFVKVNQKFNFEALESLWNCFSIERNELFNLPRLYGASSSRQLRWFIPARCYQPLIKESYACVTVYRLP